MPLPSGAWAPPSTSAGLSATLALVLPSAAFDSYMYGRSVLAFLNILLYNSSASSGSGAQLYGVEPWHFYLHNLALNFNGTLLAAMLAPPVLVLRALFAQNGGASRGPYRADKKSDTPVGGEVDDDDNEGGALPAGRLLLLLSGLYVWVCFFSAIPHKEERFMFPVYTLIPLAAALTMSTFARAIARVVGLRQRGRVVLLTAMALPCVAVSSMRAVAQVSYYSAPLHLYSQLARGPNSGVRTLCVGNEWYRFPSSFFLPAGATLGFVKDGFRGQLPAAYSSPAPEGSRQVHGHFNGRNAEESSRYVPIETCDVLVDLLPMNGAADEQERRRLHHGRQPMLPTWRFLDAAHSPRWSRALYVPYLSDARNAYAQYAALERRS